MKRVIVIPARYGSTRLPAKALADIAGKPLIQWVYERACQSALADEVLVATDDERIGNVCRAFGAPVAMTSPDCPSGTDRVFEAIRDREADIVVNLQGDEPQIRGDLLDTLFRAVEEDDLDMATLCTPIIDQHEYENPNVAKVVLDHQGFALYFSRAPLPYFRKAVSLPAYRHIGIYAFSRPFLETFVSMPVGKLEEAESLEQLRALEAGYHIKVLSVLYEGIGVDTAEDLDRVRGVLGAQT